MSGIYRRIEMFEPPPSPFSTRTSIFETQTLHLPFFTEEPDFFHYFDLFAPNPDPFEAFDNTVTDLIEIKKSPFSSSYKRVQHRTGSGHCFRSLCDRVSGLDLGLDRVVGRRDRKYRWTAEIKGSDDRKYKWTAEILRKKEKCDDKWTVGIKGRGQDVRSVSHGIKIKEACASGALELVCTGGVLSSRAKKCCCATRRVQIEDCIDHEAVVQRQVYTKRAEANAKAKGKRKELSPQDAAQMIQKSFRAHLIRRSQALRSLRELAVLKAKLKEIRGLFNNFSYRRLIARNEEELQRFSERIIVLLLTVDAIKGIDVMVRAARRSMVDELEAMLDVVDPKPPLKLGSMKRRTFDMPEFVQQEIAAGVAEVVQMLDQAEKYDNETFEVCL